jgi:hypothetical protein
MSQQHRSIDEQEFLGTVRALQDKVWPAGMSRGIAYPHGENR